MGKVTALTLTIVLSWVSKNVYASGYSDLKDLIIAKDVRSVEKLLPLLPSATKDHFALVYQGHGAQDSSPSNPRALLFGDDASVIFAFNGDVSEKGFNDFEVREFNQQTKSFEYSVVSFDPAGGRPTFSEVNAKKCLGCHGQNPVPIYTDYNAQWPGFYGDFFKPNDDITETYEDFVASMPNHPRYKFLNRQFMPPVKKGVDSAIYQPLNMLGKFEARFLALHIFNELQKSPRFLGLKYSFLYLQSSCDNSDLRQKVQDRFRSLAQHDFGTKPWFTKVSDDDLAVLVFGYDQTIAKYDQPSQFPIMDFSSYYDGLDTVYAQVIVRQLQDELINQTDLGKFVVSDPGRLELYFGARYQGAPSKSLDGILTYAYLDQKSPSACALLESKVQSELN